MLHKFNVVCTIFKLVRKIAKRVDNFFSMYVFPSIRVQNLCSYRGSFPWNLVVERFFFLENVSSNFKVHESLTRHLVLYMKTNLHYLIISRWIILRMRNISAKICREIQNTHFTSNNLFCFTKIVPFMRQRRGEKYSTTRQATDDNTAHAHFTLRTKGYKHTLRICNTYNSSSAIMIAWTHASVSRYTYIYCLFFCSLKFAFCTSTVVLCNMWTILTL